MRDQSECKHESMFWYAAPANEQGWRCADCDFRPGEPPGYSPQHDRDHLDIKVWCILQDLHQHQIVYVSNGDSGDGICASAVAQCKREDVRDQESIARILLEHCAGDGKFWREQAAGILAGKDPRVRCHCGRLAKIYARGLGFCSMDHDPEWDRRLPW